MLDAVRRIREVRGKHSRGFPAYRVVFAGCPSDYGTDDENSDCDQRNSEERFEQVVEERTDGDVYSG